MMRERLRFVAALAVVTPLGFATKFYTGPGSEWVVNEAGGLLYVVFWILVVQMLFPRVSPLRTALAVTAVTSALEFGQLWHPPFLERIRATFLGRALIGATFAWSDFPYYAAGAVVGYGVARALTGRRRSHP